jgi:F-box and WD-40 domain protein CDC4
LGGHSLLVGLLELSPHYLVSAAADSTLRIWDPNTGTCLGQLNGHAGAITCFQHDTMHNRIVSGSDGGVKSWEMCNDLNASLRELKKPSRRAPPLTYGRPIRPLVAGVIGVWKVSMDERRVVCAVQKEDNSHGNRTWFEVLDFGKGLDQFEAFR